MKHLKNRQGFTLVELIVVITILAILGTIGFLSLQGYSANARDSKRTADMRSISTAVSTKTTEGVKYVWFVTNGTTAGSRMATTGSGISGQTLNYAVNYDSGTPNYATLGIDPTKFKDPQNTEYRIGGTTLQA